MKRLVGRWPGFVASFWNDTSGIVLPYVAIMLPVIVGLSLLAIDGARYTSLQTQMQAAADALALAGARELNQLSGAQARAISAMANTSFGNDNTLSGMGTAPTFTYTYTFYQSLNAATAAAIGGTAPAGNNQDQRDVATEFVAVTVTPVTIPTIFPVTYLSPGGTNSFSAGAQAVAGFTKKIQIACDIPPVFVCNPYETSGMSDAVATSALNTNLADPATTRRQIRLDPTKSGPGQFGYLVPPDSCNGASCLENWIALAHPSTCYQSASVDLNTGFKSSVTDGFNVRFDIYQNNLKKDAGDISYAPSINVRKGYQAGTNNNWCSASAASPYTTVPLKSPVVLPNGTITTVTGDTNSSGSSNCKGNGNNPCVIKNVALTVVSQVNTWIAAGLFPKISGTNIAINSTVLSASGTTLTLNNAVTGTSTGVHLTIGPYPTSALPEDTAWTGICNGGTCLQGNGQWDCFSYWNINHPGVAFPSDLTAEGTCSSPTATTVSRYQVYRSEILNGLHTGWSFPGTVAQANTNKLRSGTGAESGAPFCAVNGVDTSTGATDRRVIFAAVINCLAQSSLITGGSTAKNIPVAGFAKFFMTQPVGVDSVPNTSTVYGEMTGLVTSLDNVKIETLNQVQLYR